jgi:large subunit ribosomal protein L9
VAELRKHEEKRARHEAQSFEQAQEIAQRLEGAELRFDVQAGETGTLFGSVTATDLAEEIWRAHRVRVDRRKLELPESIKRIGRFEVPVELFADVTATLRVAVVPEGGELPPQEELDAIAAAEAEAEAAAEAEAEAARAEAEAELEALAAQEEAEPLVRESGQVEGVPGEPGGSPAERATAAEERAADPSEE